MTREDFNIFWNGKFNPFPTKPNECVCVTKQYMQDVLGLPPFHGDAIDYWNTPPAGFKKIPKGLPPKPGDFIIFDYPPDGHISICNWARSYDFNSFEQNSPIGSPCHFVDHPNYDHVLGYLRPIPTKFVMEYTVYNGDSNLLIQAQNLLIQYSGGKLDCRFDFKTIPTQSSFTTDQQIQFLKVHATNQFIFYFYDAHLSGSQMATAEVPQTGKILTAATPFIQDPNFIVYEMVNGMYDFLHQPGDDIYVPSPEFTKQKLAKLMPFVDKLISKEV